MVKPVAVLGGGGVESEVLFSWSVTMDSPEVQIARPSSGKRSRRSMVSDYALCKMSVSAVPSQCR